MNYPLKTSLIRLEENGCFDILDEVHKFCVSSVAVQVSYSAVENLIDADNAHRIPEQNGGMPNVLAYRSQQAIGEVSPDVVPSIDEAICEFTKQAVILLWPLFGIDPIQGCPALQQEREKSLEGHRWNARHFQLCPFRGR